MKILISIVIILATVFGCSPLGYQVPKHEKLADRITDTVGKTLKKEKGLSLIGTGGQMMDDIKKMSMSFQYFQVVSIEKARELVVYATTEYLSAINSNHEIRPYLNVYPFTLKNVELVVFFVTPDGYNVPKNEISIVAMEKGNVVFYVNDPTDDRLKVIQTETYDEALKAIAASKN
ncbi:MAG: hypothetical protein KDK63_03800 [Chlamydiia bacterium]|nr:hypothetical protein [Chlamydiia bacterium]